MAYVCESFEVINNIQTCVYWVEFNYLPPLAITQAEAVDIGIAVGEICGLLIAYAFITKALKIS